MDDNTILYRIAGWSKHFENNRTRELRRMEFVLMPNKMDGDGYTELLNHPNGAAHFGAWCALVQVASKCDPRGTLVRGNGKPHTPESLERLTRIPVSVFLEVLPRLVEIGWMSASRTEDGSIPQGDGTKPHDVGSISHPPAESCGAYAGAHAIERNGTERNGTESSSEISVVRKPTTPTKPKHLAESIAWVREALSDYQCGAWGVPDDGICVQVLDATRGSPLEALREFLLQKLNMGQKPDKSWGWFVQIVKTHFGGAHHGDTAAVA